jgi:glutathione S-transferase
LRRIDASLGHPSAATTTIVSAVQRLYQRAGAGRPHRVRWALEEAGAPYEWVVMDAAEGRGPEHAQRHPLGRVPVLETDEGLLFESAALCLHVADLYADSGLAPAPGTFGRARVYQWVLFAMTELEPALIRTYLAREREGADGGATAKEAARLARAGDAIVDALDGGEFLLGDFSVADVVVGGVLTSARQYDLLPTAPALHAYLERLDARPAKQRAYDRG